MRTPDSPRPGSETQAEAFCPFVRLRKLALIKNQYLPQASVGGTTGMAQYPSAEEQENINTR